MSIEVVSMEQLITEIRAINQRLEKGVGVVKDYEETLNIASQAYEVAKAKALQDTSGTVADREAQVTLAITKERQALDAARTAWNYAKAKLKHLESQLMSTQSQLSAVKVTYMSGGE